MPTTDAVDVLRQQVESVADRWLSAYAPRFYRAGKVVRDVVWGMIDILPHELAFIDSPFFQRLRRVHQTSLALLTYPCAGHSRFEHSLGCLGLADRVLRALGRRINITEKDRLVVRLAALLHDCTHGPFSHTSEAFYKSNKIFLAIRNAQPTLFERASASEILTYCVITSNPFKELWRKVLEQYSSTSGLLTDLERWRIATMVVGADYNAEHPEASLGAEYRFLRQLVNGPFDVDKLDYVARDGYFTGLNLAIDIERLLWVIDTVPLEPDEDGHEARVVCVSASGATTLEQLLFSKMQLYSSIYHHHKVRVAHQAVLRLLSFLEAADVHPKGLRLSDPATFLCLDDADVLHAPFQGAGTTGTSDPNLQQARVLALEIEERRLPMRALVLTHPVWGPDPRQVSDADRKAWQANMKAVGQPDRLAAEVAGAARLKDSRDVWVDIPEPAPLQGTAQEGIVKFDDKSILPIIGMFPIGGWLSGYEAFRTISYIFARQDRDQVGRAAQQVLSTNYKITVNNLALKLARVD